MVIAAVAAALVIHRQDTQSQPTQITGTEPSFVSITLDSLHDPKSKLMVQHNLKPLPQAKESPRHRWQFPFGTFGYCQVPGREGLNLRFRVFSQSRKANHDDVAQWSTRLLTRLWDYSYFRVRRDHALAYRGLVDFYLCFGGEPGAEQLFDIDDQDLDDNDRPQRVNTVYIYRIDDIGSPLELLRELCHEYGHAVLPPVGGYSGPEGWSNGDLGERVFMNWLSQDLKAGKLSAEDTVFVPADKLDAYLAEKFIPLVKRIATKGPDLAALAGKDAAAYEEYVALGCFAAAVLPHKTFARSQNLLGQSGAEYDKELRFAVDEMDKWEVQLPSYLAGQAVYLPTGDCKVSGGKVLARKGGWIKIQPTGGKLTVTKA